MREYIIGVPERTGFEDPAIVHALHYHELVRCKDCALWKARGNQEGFCTQTNAWHKDDWFCADGRKRE